MSVLSREWLLTETPTSRWHARASSFYKGWLALRSNTLAMVGLGILVFLLAVAALFIGGLGLWHGILVILGKDVGRVSEPGAEPKPLPRKPAVEEP